MVSRLFLFSKNKKAMKRTLFYWGILLILQFVASLKVNAGNSVVNKGTITIYVGEEKTMYHSIPYQYYVTATSWFLRETSGSAWSDGQEMCGAKIVSKNSESCTIKGMWDNDDIYNLSWCELHCKGTKSNGEYYECYWKVIVKSYGTLKVNASPAGGKVDEGTVVTLTANSNGSTVSGCDIYYTLDGTTPTRNSNKYTSSGITITKSGWLKANAFKAGYMTFENIPDEWYFNVTPSVIKVTSITLNKTSLSLQPEQEETLTATVKPDNATDKTVTWSSSNDNVATVNNGTVTAKAAGSATITCKANDGSGKQATCAVTVNKPVGIDINTTNFPDANFRNYLLSQSYGQDGVLTDKEIQGITYISVSSKNISSLKGIEFFTALKELWCYVNQLTSLDVSKNTELTKLICYANQLTSLDVSKNTALTALDCQSNPLKSLDVSKNAALEDLNCGSTQLTSLDVTKNTALKKLYCYNNQLTSLDVSKNTALINLWCYINQIKGTAMDNLISGLPKNTTGDQHKFNVVAPTRDTEGNVCTKAQVAAVKTKGWFPCYYDSSTQEYVEYEGSEDAIATGNGTKSDPFNAVAANKKGYELEVGEISSDSYYVRGKISAITYTFNAKYGTATFYISDDGTETNQFYVYASYYLENKPWIDSNSQISIGDDVIVYGKITNYKGTPEMADKQSYIYSHNGQITSDSQPTIKGDVNGDGYVNGTDLVALTNIILGKSEEKASADVNGDGYVNGTDYVALVNIILGRSNAHTY